MTSTIRYIRSQLAPIENFGNEHLSRQAVVDRIGRALDALARLEAAAADMQSDIDELRADRFAAHVDASNEEWTIEEILAREG